MTVPLSTSIKAANPTSIGAGAMQIARGIAAGRWTAQQVVEEHLARIDAVNGELNAVVVVLAESARREAAACDARLARGEVPRPLEGVPVTIKECFHVAGTASTLGLPSRRQQLEPHDGAPVAALRRAGAVILGKTNVPQLMMWHETDNPLYGKTLHPLDPTRTCGGSSGGEAAIIAADGSPLGLASDLGGSIRIPAHFCGCVGLMPTPGRITRDGATRTFTNVRELKVTAGFIARRVEDLAMATSLLLRECPAADSPQEDMPLSLSTDTARVAGLRIGVVQYDGSFPAARAIERAVSKAANILAAAEAAIVELPPLVPERELLEVYFGLMGADGNAELRSMARGGQIDPRVRRMLRYGRLPRCIRPALSALLRRANRGRLADLLLATGVKTSNEVEQLVERCRELRREAAERLDQAGIDAIISPPHALAAFPHGLGVELLPAASYAFAMNLLGYPAGVVPVTTVHDDETEIKNGQDRLERLAFTAQLGSAGLPVGVQVAARQNREDVVLAVMSALETGCQ